RMVLDSTVDPTGVWYADNFAQDYAFQGRIEAFFRWTAANSATFHLGATAAAVARSYATAKSRLTAPPVNSPIGPLIGPDELGDTFIVGGYNDQFWPDLATALTQFLHQGSTSLLVRLYKVAGQQKENEFAVYNAVECSDVNWPRNWARW